MVAPLASLKVLEFSSLVPGPFAGMLLADLGADVIRIESPRQSDLIRDLPPFDGDVSTAHAVLNRSKRSLALDLKHPDAPVVVRRLVQTYDIVLECFRPGVLDRLGVGYDALRAANPALIYCALTGYGQTGPYRDRAGHDLNYLALSGIASHSGRVQSGPPPLGVQIADLGGGSLYVVVGILAAVIARAETGLGQFIDVAMLDGAVAWNAAAVGEYLATREDPQREAHWLNGGSFYDYYGTRDDGYVAVAGLEPKFWSGFCSAVGRPDLEPLGWDRTPETVRALKAELRAMFRERTLAEWTALFAQHDVCVEPVLGVGAALAHPQVEARGLLVGVPREDGTLQPQVGCPVKFSVSEPTYRFRGVRTGAHTDDVLRSAGYDGGEIAALRAAHVVS